MQDPARFPQAVIIHPQCDLLRCPAKRRLVGKGLTAKSRRRGGRAVG